MRESIDINLQILRRIIVLPRPRGKIHLRKLQEHHLVLGIQCDHRGICAGGIIVTALFVVQFAELVIDDGIRGVKINGFLVLGDRVSRDTLPVVRIPESVIDDCCGWIGFFRLCQYDNRTIDGISPKQKSPQSNKQLRVILFLDQSCGQGLVGQLLVFLGFRYVRKQQIAMDVFFVERDDSLGGNPC